ncbi:hypothetical protein AMTRI_Chr02g212560 [Amborella trichopoda]
MGYSKGHICQCLSRIATIRPDSPVTIYGNRLKTGNEFVTSVVSLAKELSDSGLERGDVVAIAALNSDYYLEWLLAVAYVGAIAAPLNHRWSLEEVRSAIELVQPAMLVVDNYCGPWAAKFQKTIKFHANLATNNNYAIRTPPPKPIELDFIQAPESIVLICFTSGTTGKPKGVAIDHTALIVQSLAKIAIVGYNEDDVYLHTAPLCHIGGISSGLAMLMAGACHVFIPKFEAKSVLQAINQNNVTSFITVPTMMADLLSFLGKTGGEGRFKSVKKILNGAGSLSDPIARAVINIFPHAKLLSAYGMTEASSSLTFMPLPLRKNDDSYTIISHSDNRPGGTCVGKPAPHVELQIREKAVINSCPIGAILTRGPHVMTKYWGENPTGFPNKGGWLNTGDMGWIDEKGNLWLLGREKDRIKTGGENVFPQEVEAILSRHPGIAGVVVVGIPDDRFTEAVIACVRVKEKWSWGGDDPHATLQLSSSLLRDYCKQQNLSGFKIPKICLVRNKPFPLTSTGKVRRDEVRAQIMSIMHIKTSNL